MARSNANTTGTINIVSSGEAVALELNGRDTVTLHITEDATATYQIDGRVVGGTWRENIGPTTFSGGGDHSKTFDFAAEEIRVRCSTGAGGSDNNATITLMAGG
jgi:hypothetical protein